VARCRCAEGACGCALVAGTNTTVTGEGTTKDPWVVSAGDHGYLAVADTATINLERMGDGSSANPYLLTAHSLVTPPTGGSHVTFTDTTEVDFTTAGAGTAADPMVVSALLPLITFTGGNPGDVLTMDATGVFYPGPPTQAPVGSVSTGFGISGDGSGANPFRVDLCTYDDLKAACAP
jgi:hypothetical protein